MATCGEAEEGLSEVGSAWLAFRLGKREAKWLV
jgi:hypothetical protein